MNGYDRNRPQYEWGTKWTKKGSTEKQAIYIAKLIDNLVDDGYVIQAMMPVNELTRGQASQLINELKDVSVYKSTRYLEKNCSPIVAVEHREM